MDSIDRELNDLMYHKKSYFRAGLNYLENNVYFGRKDTVLTPYINASLGYYHKSGLFVSASASYLPSGGQSRVDLVTAEAGYSFTAGKFQGQATAVKYFFNNQSNNVEADLEGNVSFFGAYDFGFIKPIITPSVNIGNKLDFGMTLGIEHTFYSDNNKFDITPIFNVNGSTQNYYNSYYRDRKFRKKLIRIFNPQELVVTGEVLKAAQFKILDYEFSLPLNYIFGRVTFNFTPTYVIPVNPAMVTITGTLTTQSGAIITRTKTIPEKIENSFFWQAGLAYRF
jgi:hypothetical protein